MKHVYSIYQIIKDVNKTQVSLSQFLALEFMTQNGNVTSRKLADYLKVTPTAITVHIDALERDGYVVRVRSTDDRRQVFLQITPSGSQALAEWGKALSSVI